MFKPVVQRLNVEWAELNRLAKPRRRSNDAECIAIEEGSRNTCNGISQVDKSSSENSAIHHAWEQRGEVESSGIPDESSDFLDDHLRKHGLRGKAPRKHFPHGLKSASPYGTVLDIWTEHQGALDPRKILDQLKNRHKFPWKTLAFDQQVRPPYSGTFTKKSVAVGPRTPFAQDPILDYSYDSGDDWQDDEGGDDVEDFDDLPRHEEEDEDDESEGEFDGWLDDGGEEESVPYEQMDIGHEMPEPISSALVVQSRVSMKVTKRTKEGPKRVIKVTPYWKGPMWERRIGDGSEGMEAYRLQLLDGKPKEHCFFLMRVADRPVAETPDTIDPFTYVSSEDVQQLRANFSSVIIGTNLSVRCLLSTEGVSTSEAALHRHETYLISAQPNDDILTLPRSRPTGPRKPFPTSHLPELLRLIEGNTKIRTDLVSQLKAHFDTVTSKAAIEAKIKEVASRVGRARDSRWKVLPQAWVGFSPAYRCRTADIPAGCSWRIIA